MKPLVFGCILQAEGTGAVGVDVVGDCALIGNPVINATTPVRIASGSNADVYANQFELDDCLVTGTMNSLKGDRAAWDTTNYLDHHARDISDETYGPHLSAAERANLHPPVTAGHTIEDEGTPLTQRAKLNFVGTGVAVTDDSGDDASVVTIQKYSELDLDTIVADTKDPTGWVDPDAVAAATTYDSATRIISISGTHAYYWRGIKKSVTNFASTAHTNTTGHQYYLYSTDGDTFAWTTDTPWEFHHLMVASVNFQTAYKYGSPEPHGLMPWNVHEELHSTIGTYKESGGTLDPTSYTTGSTTATNRRPNVVATVLHDEDIMHTLDALTSKTYHKFSLSGTNTVNLSGETAEIVSVTGNMPNYNLFTGGAWTQAPMTNAAYMCVWLVALPVTHDAASEAFRYMWIQGQSKGTLSAQQALAPLDVSFGSLSDEAPEFTFLVKVIIAVSGNNWTIHSVQNISGSHFSQHAATAGAYLSVVTTDATLTGQGTTGDPLSVVQSYLLLTEMNASEASELTSGEVTALHSHAGEKAHTIEDEGTPLTARTKLNFVGAGVTVTDDAGDDASVVTIPSGSAHTIEDEGTPLTARTKLNFVGAGVTVTDDAGDDASVVTIPSGSAHTIEDEGTPLTARTKLNFVGAGVTVTDDAGDDASVVTVPLPTGKIEIIIDGGGAAIAAGTVLDFVIPRAVTITDWTLLADVSGSIVIDLWRNSYANFPPTVADTQVGSDKPTLTSALKATSSALTGWTTTWSAGDIIRVNIDSAAACKRVCLALSYT